MTRPRCVSVHDQAGLIGKVAVLWIVLLLLVGLLVLDGISIALTTFRLSNTAQSAASTAATRYHDQGGDASGACAAAENDLIADAVLVPDNDRWCRIDPSTGQATITLRTTASSLALGRLSFTRDFTDVNVKESAEPAL